MNLTPRIEPQRLTVSVWLDHTPGENKLELMDGEALYGGEERDKLLMALLYNIGFEHLLKILPLESKQLLTQLCQKGTQNTVDASDDPG